MGIRRLLLCLLMTGGTGVPGVEPWNALRLCPFPRLASGEPPSRLAELTPAERTGRLPDRLYPSLARNRHFDGVDPAGSRYGLEIEVPDAAVARLFSRIDRYFDWQGALDRAWRGGRGTDPFRNARARDLDAFLDHPEHLNYLPESVRRALTEGGEPSSLRETARGRWRELPRREKTAALMAGRAQEGDRWVRAIERLPASLRAVALVDSLPNKAALHLGSEQTLRPRPEYAEALSDWNWYRDGHEGQPGVLEFVLKGTKPTWQSTWETTLGLAEKIGFEDQVFHGQGPDFPLHVHVSREAEIPDRVLRGLQISVLTDIAARGPKSLQDWLSSTFTSYNVDLEGRGLTRRPEGERNRVEFRAVPDELGAHMETYLGVLRQGENRALETLGERVLGNLSSISPAERQKALAAIGEREPAALMDLHDALLELPGNPAAEMRREVLRTISAGLEREGERYGRAVQRLYDYSDTWREQNAQKVLGELYGLDRSPAQLARVLRAAGAPEEVVRAAANNYVEFARRPEHRDWVEFAVQLREGQGARSSQATAEEALSQFRAAIQRLLEESEGAP